MTTASLRCLSCNLPLSLSSPNTINTTSCLQSSTTTQTCSATLDVNHAAQVGTVTFGGDNIDASRLQKKTMIEHRMIITLLNDQHSRKLTLRCQTNDSCSEELKKIYNQGKNLNYIVLQDRLKNLLTSSVIPAEDLTCSNNHDQEIPCPRGCCELTNTGNTGVNRKCIPGCPGVHIDIKSQVLGPVNVESSFTYRCMKSMCNDKDHGNRVRNVLKEYHLLTPTGTDTQSNSAAIVSSHAMVVIQSLLMTAVVFFAKLN